MTILENNELVFRMREMAKSGHNTISILKFLVDELGLGKNSRLIVITYFWKAFSLSIREAKPVGAWEFFDGGTLGRRNDRSRNDSAPLLAGRVG